MNSSVFRIIRTVGFAVLALAATGAACRGDEVEAGATRAEVIDRLGEPDGTVQVGKTEFLHYARGIVELEDGAVVHSTVISEAEHQRRVEEQRRQAEEKRQQAEARRQELMRQGAAEKERVLADGSVAKRSPADQVAYWKRFAKTYPGVDASKELADAQGRLDAENKRKQELAEQEANEGPPAGMSSRQLRKWKRGRGRTEE